MKTIQKKIKELEVMVADVIEETYDTTTLVLFTGNDILTYEPGHFLTISPYQFEGLERWTAYLEHLKGKKEAPRAYSMSSAPHEKYLAITVKEESYISGKTQYPPLLSPILAKRISRGTRMMITGFTGPYTLSDDTRRSVDCIVHVCAGSGIVPSYSIIKHDLRCYENTKHNLVYSNKTLRDVIFLEQLRELEREFPDRFKLILTLTREKEIQNERGNIHLGRISSDILNTVIPEPGNVAVFVCGPDHSVWTRKAARESGEELRPSFMACVLEHLETAGVSKDRITKESYG